MSAPIGSIGTAVQTLGSALKSFGVAVATTADNIANADSASTSTQQVSYVSTAPGMRALVQPTTDQPVDLTRQLVDLSTASASYQATARALASILRTEDQVSQLIG